MVFGGSHVSRTEPRGLEHPAHPLRSEGLQGTTPHVGRAVTGLREGEEGSGTVLHAGLLAFLATLGILLVSVSGLLVAKQKVQSVADMAALAGADLSSVGVFSSGGDSGACAMAAQVVEANTSSLSSCWVAGTDTFVVASKDFRVGPFAVEIKGRARAGPQRDP